MIKLYLMDASREGQTFDFEGDSICIGRSTENDIRVKDRFVSRSHLRIFKQGEAYFIEDLKSKNGTLVDGRRIDPGTKLEVEEGVPIAIGMSVLCLGKGCLEGIMNFLDMVFSSEELDELRPYLIKDGLASPPENRESIYKLASVLTEAQNIREIAERVLDYLFANLQDIDRAMMILLEKGTGGILEVFPRLKNGSDDTIGMYSRALVRRVITEGQAVVVSGDSSGKKETKPQRQGVMKINAVMCVPLLSGEEVMGVIYVDCVERPCKFQNQDVALVTALSGSAATAITKALAFSE
jgi:hypothetical protein